MNIKMLKLKKKLNKSLRATWYTLMKPLANFLTKMSNKKHLKLKKECENISDEELMAKFAKYIVKDLIDCEYVRQKEFIVAHKYSIYDDDFEERIMYQLRNIKSSCKDKILKNWYYHNKKARIYYYADDNGRKELIDYEIKLNTLLKQELDKLEGVHTEYVDVRKIMVILADSDYYNEWLNQIGYEKSLIVRLK